MRVCFLAAFVLLAPAEALAEWTVKPFLGVVLGSSHGFVDLDATAGQAKPLFGGAVGWRWTNGFGVELELATSPRFLKGSAGLVDTGRLDTYMANATWTLSQPKRLRPYVSGGLGAARVTFADPLNAFTSTSTRAAANAGGGLLIPLRRARLVGDVRYVRSQYGDANRAGFGEEYVAYWRAVAGLLFEF